MQGTLDRVASALLGLVYPSECPVCKRDSDCFSTAPICWDCWKMIKRLEGSVCRVCYKPMVSEHAGTCGECLGDPPPFERAVAYGAYHDTLRKAIHLVKFGSVKRLARPLARLVLDMDIPEADAVIPVPMGPLALRQREFNQTYLIARYVGRRLGLPVLGGILFKKRDTQPQVGLSRAARIRNLQGAFGMRRKLGGERILLIDDVITTGTTVRECAKALRRSGAGSVNVVAIARTVPGRHEQKADIYSS